MNAKLILAALALSALTGWQGYRMGVSAEETRQALLLTDAQRRAIERTNDANRAEAERLALQAERDALALELEDLARADPDASRPALSAGSVRRLNSR